MKKKDDDDDDDTKIAKAIALVFCSTPVVVLRAATLNSPETFDQQVQTHYTYVVFELCCFTRPSL